MLPSLNLESVFSEAMSGHLDVVHHIESQRKRLEEIADRMTQAVLGGNNILWCGNGGSATDAQHLAAELVGRFRRDRAGLASIALTEDAATVMGIANDYSFQEVFARQVEALCQPGVLVQRIGAVAGISGTILSYLLVLVMPQSLMVRNVLSGTVALGRRQSTSPVPLASQQ